jgi:hypothetical protein
MRKSILVGTIGATVVLVTAGPAVATSYEIDLTAGDIFTLSSHLSYWDQYNDGTTCIAASGYTPMYDSTFLDADDAFDGGFEVTVGANNFVDPDSTATLQDGVLSTGGAAALGGLKVNSTARAIPNAPGLQYLVKFKNPTKSAIKRQVTVSTNLGSDTSTTLLKDSSGDGVDTNADRWVISGDAATPPFTDPVVTQVLRGKNPPAATSVPHPLTNGDECLAETYTVRVPGGQSRYLLLFGEMHYNTSAGKQAAVQDVKSFEQQKTMGGALKGIPTKLYAKIVNWNLSK